MVVATGAISRAKLHSAIVHSSKMMNTMRMIEKLAEIVAEYS